MRTLELWQTAGFSERAHRYFMRTQNNNSACLRVMNRGFPWWGGYRYNKYQPKMFNTTKYYGE